MSETFNPSQLAKTLKTKNKTFTIYHLPKLTKLKIGNPENLPFSIRILLESAVRNCDNFAVTRRDIENILNWSPSMKKQKDIAFKPGRVILQDFTGVPCVVDLAAMRSALKRLGGDYRQINPQVQCDLVIDHSVQVDAFGTAGALGKNVALEFKRNQERYEFLKWGQNAFKNFRVVPPATGIVHQVNLEYLAKGVLTKKSGKNIIAYPDSLVGTDSHTTMINGLGIVGWGVGGIEAEAVMLGEPICMLLPEVVGFKLAGRLKEGITATDLVLRVTEILRKHGVVGKFVEFFGEGLQNLSIPDRATISNMAPEYGATTGIFPIDQKTLDYYRLTGSSPAEVDLIERYFKEQGLFYTPGQKGAVYTETLELDISTVEPSLAGPKRPQDRVPVNRLKDEFQKSLTADTGARGFGLEPSRLDDRGSIGNGPGEEITHGSVVIAAITSCTNTSNPSVLIGAGLVARRAVEKGLKVKPFVKTSFAPGSQVVEEYMREAGLMRPLEKLGFHIVGYGCTTCIGNSGPLPEKVSAAIQSAGLVAASVLSGNRNFEGRINPHTRANFLASPPLVVAYALAGTVNIDLASEPVGRDKKGNEVYLRDIWPSEEEIRELVSRHVTARVFRRRYKNVTQGNENWNRIKETKSDLFQWKAASTYIQEPPFFTEMGLEPGSIAPVSGARCLVKVGDSITTDHISPAGSIAKDSPAGEYLKSLGVDPGEFNSYGSRRGNDRVMTRGTFANIRLRNQLAPGTEGAWTVHFPDGEKMSIYDASLKYKLEKTPLIVLAGKEYGTGSSRDWAAKGTALLGVRAVIAESYERIHRSNLAGMGVVPLQFKDGENAASLGLSGDEIFGFDGIDDGLIPGRKIMVTARSPRGKVTTFGVICRLDTKIEIEYVRNGGILQTVLLKLAK
jgi:aconitate hydratase